MKNVYPTLIAENNGTFLVYVPDMDIYTQKDMIWRMRFQWQEKRLN